MHPRTIETKIYEVRKQKIMLDFDLSEMYEVENRALKQAVKRNIDRFPPDFMFQLTKKEWQEVITNCDNLPDNVKFSPATPYAFTEQGVAMLSSVLKSKKALQVNIAIMRAFVFIRQYTLSHKDLTDKLKGLETKYDKQFKDVYDAINFLLQKDKEDTMQMERKQIGFRKNNRKEG
jgi:hypothetical protein